ncbi:MAG: outer membrane beta-barrel protein [Bacteroidetes bacterium]|nr:outer membrane beta-barrel protein [Bacteroidota bacterium]HET6245697.1 outer membrane beta-barrel protein [Bacteroidia bacterium]
MKKIILLFVLFVGVCFGSQAQFLHAYGATLGITRATEIGWLSASDTPQKMKYRTGFNGSLFLEFFNHDVFTWVMEAQYNQKGVRMLDEFGNVDFKHRTNYGSFNNFLKARAEGIDINLYVLAGPRIEYLISQNSTLPFNQLHFSISGGVGCDFNYWEPIIFFTEVHFNPDITPSANVGRGQTIRNRALELRIGIKKKIQSGRNRDVCPPVFL